MKDAGKFLDEKIFKHKSPLAGDFIRAQRKLLGLSLDELEHITGIEKSNLSAYENNKKEIGLKVAVKLAVALGLDAFIIIKTTVNQLEMSNEIKGIAKKSQKILKSKEF